MKKFQVIGLVLLAVFALSVVIVATASAETTLQAFWLRNGVVIEAELVSETTGELKLEDTKTLVGAVAVSCSATFLGNVGSEDQDLVTGILNLGRALISSTILSGLALLCETTKACETDAKSPIEVWPENLPWPSLLFLMENGEILDLIEKVGYDILCLVVGIMAEDLCEIADLELPVLDEPTAETPSGAVALPLSTCNEGGVGSGVNEITALSTISLVEGGELTVSSE